MRSENIRKVRVWYFGGIMYQQEELALGANPITSIDISVINKCKVELATWGYVTLIWEEISSGLY